MVSNEVEKSLPLLVKKGRESNGQQKIPKSKVIFLLPKDKQKNIKKNQAVKGNAKKLHIGCYAECVAIFLQNPCRISYFCY